MLTEEWTPLEPNVLDHKFYVRGVGTALEITAKGAVGAEHAHSGAQGLSARSDRSPRTSQGVRRDLRRGGA